MEMPAEHRARYDELCFALMDWFRRGPGRDSVVILDGHTRRFFENLSASDILAAKEAGEGLDAAVLDAVAARHTEYEKETADLRRRLCAHADALRLAEDLLERQVTYLAREAGRTGNQEAQDLALLGALYLDRLKAAKGEGGGPEYVLRDLPRGPSIRGILAPYGYQSGGS